MFSHNNWKDYDSDFENYDAAAADDDDIADSAAADDVDVDALVFTISLVLISSHWCLSGLVLCNLLHNKKCPCINL